MLARVLPFPQLSHCRIPPSSCGYVLRKQVKGLRAQFATATTRSPPSLPKQPFRAVPTDYRVPAYVNKLFDKLLKAKAATILYEAPSQGGYIICAYFTGLSILASAAWMYHIFVLNPPRNVQRWIPFVYRFVCSGLVVLGGYAVLRASNLVTRVTAVPTNGVLRFYIQSRRIFPLPLVRRKTFDVTIDMVEPASSKIIATALPRFSHLEDPVLTIKTEAAPRLGARLRASIRACFDNERRVLTQEAFAFINLKGRWGQWRIDLNGNFHPEVVGFGRTVSQSQTQNQSRRS